MNVLIIGNGFDLANELPTKYKDYLNLCRVIRNSSGQFSPPPNIIYWENENDKILHDAFCNKVQKEYFTEFYKIVKDNLFISHFLEREPVIGENWMNFEEEIERFVEWLIKEMHEAPDERFRSSKLRSVKEFTRLPRASSLGTYKDLFLSIRAEHRGLIRSLEIYMDGYINNIDCKKISNIKKGVYDHVLSFNYTDTYSEKYEPEIGCCYIHGRANLERTIPCNMVLGFDDRYKNHDLTELEALPYEKFFQRLDLKTSNEYLKWIEDMKGSENNIVDIYGHSLAQADADILKQFILLDNTYTRVFCYNDSDRYEKMRNLTLILGSELTIKLVGGNNPRISFIPMSDYSIPRI